MNSITDIDINGSVGDIDKKTIMAVDSVSQMLCTLESIVVGGGYSFVSARSGESAIELIESTKPDLLILRTDMPDMDAYDLAERLNKHGYKVPMFFLSDKVTAEGVVKAYLAGAKDYILKPVDRKTTLSKIAKQFA